MHVLATMKTAGMKKRMREWQDEYRSNTSLHHLHNNASRYFVTKDLMVCQEKS